MRRFLVMITALAACSTPQSINPEPSAEAQQGQGDDCGAICYAELPQGVSLPQADYEPLAACCVGRATWGWIDVSGLLSATSAVDVHVVATVGGNNVGPEVQAPLGPVLATPVGGAVYVGPGKYLVELRVATGAPDAAVQALERSWIRGEARQDLPVP